MLREDEAATNSRFRIPVSGFNAEAQSSRGCLRVGSLREHAGEQQVLVLLRLRRDDLGRLWRQDASHHRATSGIAVSDKACGAQTRSVLSHGDTKGALGLARFARSLVSSNQTIKQSKQSNNSLGRVERVDHVDA